MPENQPPPAQPTPPPPANTPSPEQQARTWNMWCHLSALAGLLFPFGNVLGPLIVWQVKKQEFPSVETHGKASLNFQITVAIAEVASIILGFILSFICIGFLLFFVTFAVVIAGVVFAVIAGIKANDGQEYKYPWSLTLVK
jgi:hypothetical protein